MLVALTRPVPFQSGNLSWLILRKLNTMSKTKKRYRVAVVGATAWLAKTVLELLAERGFPVREVIALASERSIGRQVNMGSRVADLVDDLH